MKKRITLITVGVLVVFGLGLLIGFILPRLAGGPGQRYYNTATVLRQVQTLSELVTVKYVMEKVVIQEDVKWIAVLGESRVLLVARGTAKAGINLGEMKQGDIHVSGKNIRIKLPPPRITDAYLDEKETRIIERSTGLLRSFDKDLEQNARINALDDIRRAARTSGILKDAEDRARTQLTTLFQQMGFERVEFEK